MCIGEREVFGRGFDEVWSWRSGGYLNKIERNIHGDLYVQQIDSSEKIRVEDGLFGEEEQFESMRKNPSRSSFGAHQEWSEFLVSLLRYSKEVGLDKIPEIVDWEGTLEKIGGGTSGFYAEAIFPSGSELGVDLLLSTRGLLTKNRPLDMMPLEIFNQSANYFPYFDGERLIFLKETRGTEKGFDLNREELFLRGRKFVKGVSWGPEDLPEALRGAYKYFARDRSRIPLIMERFIEGKVTPRQP